jgi:hypothetical protein
MKKWIRINQSDLSAKLSAVKGFIRKPHPDTQDDLNAHSPSLSNPCDIIQEKEEEDATEI